MGDYLVATESDKGHRMASVAGLPDRYRREVDHPRTVFETSIVLLAIDGASVVGCGVLAPAVEGVGEIKRLFVAPGSRGHGHAGRLVDALVEAAERRRDACVRLTVWSWREAAMRLYRARGFTDVASWDPRLDLVCMERELVRR